jgi:hypothetical protein
MPSHAFICDSEENLVLTSKFEDEAWRALELLVNSLGEDNDSKSRNPDLFSWRNGGAHQAFAKEVYAWREIIETIKSLDLENLALKHDDWSALAKSKPIMLRVAGEITAALLHSYDKRHKITFSQIEKIEPS